MQVGQRSRSIFFSIILVLSSILVSLVEAPLAHAELVACRGAFATRTVAFSESEWLDRAEREVAQQRRMELPQAVRLQTAEAFFVGAWDTFRSLAQRPISNRREIQFLIGEAMGPVASAMVGSSQVPSGSQGYALDQAWMVHFAGFASLADDERYRGLMGAIARGSRTDLAEERSTRLGDVLTLTDRDFMIACYARFGRWRIEPARPLGRESSVRSSVHLIDQSLSHVHALRDPEVVFRLSILATRGVGSSAELALGYLREIEVGSGMRP